MRRKCILPILVFILLLSHSDLFAEIADSSAHGFTIKATFKLASVSPEIAYNNLVSHIGDWWDANHTWSGNAKNLNLTTDLNGCFCEKLDGGGFVRHMTVVYADPGKLLRMTGGLGPLQGMPINGVLTFSFTKLPEGTQVEMTYAVSGYTNVALSSLAPIVDRVMGLQMDRYQKFCN